MTPDVSDDTTPLILACARAAGTTDPNEIRRLASAVTDWELVRDTASAHSLLPLLAARLRGANVALPLCVEDAVASAVARNLGLVASLLRARALLAAADIQTIAFKGPALSVTLYDDPALRQSNDIDLLVRRDQALAARRLLQAADYRYRLDLTSNEEDRFLRYSNEYALRDPDGSIVELSWALVPRHLALDLDADRFFRDSRAIELGGAPVGVLAPHDQLVALTVHGGKHLWERLAWITDVAQLLASTPDLDVDLSLSRARSAGAERLVLVAAAMCRDVLGAHIPPGLIAGIEGDPVVHALTSTLRRRLLPLDRRHRERILEPLTLRLRERGRDRATIVSRLAWTSTVEDWRWVRLPHALSFAYPVVRPFRLAKKYLLS